MRVRRDPCQRTQLTIACAGVLAMLLQRLSLKALLWSLLVIGVIFIGIPKLVSDTWYFEFGHEIGTAVFIAAFLGLTVDSALKTALARDVARAALGVVFPEEFRTEIRRITSYTFLIENQHMHIKLELLDNGRALRMTMETEKTVRNITQSAQPLEATLALDEWDIEGQSSEITECRLLQDGHPPLNATIKTANEHSITVKTERVIVPAGGSAQITSRGSETRYLNDDLTIWTLWPAKNPTLEVSVPDSLECIFGFGVPDEQVRASRFAKRATLQGMSFPGQVMRVRWWPAAIKPASGS